MNLNSFHIAEDIMNDEIVDIISDIDSLKSRLDIHRSKDNYRIQEALELEYTYESNRIEGNTLSLRETDLVINEGLTISGKPLKDHLEAINHRDAIDYIKELVQDNIVFSKSVLLDIHGLILRGIDKENAGRYRSVPVMIKGSSHTPPQPYQISEDMDVFFDWFMAHKSMLHPVIFASEAHERLVSIHPFIDGNGRTSRLLMNLILLQNGYPIVVLKGDVDSRLKYYECLETCQMTGNRDSFILLVSNVLKDTLKRLIGVIEG